MSAPIDPEFLSLTEHKMGEFNQILDRNAEALAGQRSQAATRSRAGMRGLKPSAKGRTAKELLHQVRYGRHGL